MLNKETATAECKKIISGKGFNRNLVPAHGRGNIAKKDWYDGLFTLGTEYGALAALIMAFDIDTTELWGDSDE